MRFKPSVGLYELSNRDLPSKQAADVNLRASSDRGNAWAGTAPIKSTASSFNLLYKPRREVFGVAASGLNTATHFFSAPALAVHIYEITSILILTP